MTFKALVELLSKPQGVKMQRTQNANVRMLRVTCSYMGVKIENKHKATCGQREQQQ